MCTKMVRVAVTMLACLLMFTPCAQADDVVWDFENGNDHGFVLQSLVPATPAPQDPDRAGDESITGIGGPNGLPGAGIAWTICDLYEFEGLLPALTEGNNIINGRLVPTNSLPQGRGPSQLGQTGYLNTYAITMWGDNLHTATNDQVATSPLVDLGQGSVMTVHALGGTGTYRAPEHDPDPAQWYTTGSCGIAILNRSGEIVESLFTPSQNWREYTVDLSHLAGQKVTVEVVDAFAGGWGWIAIDQIRITNAKVIGGVGLARNPSPDDQATDVPLGVTLSWTAGQYAATHDVYFGTDFTDVNDAGRANPRGVLVSQGQTATAYDPPELLDFATVYYWRIDEVNAPPDSTIFKGNVWSFTTEPLAYPMENVVATSNGISEAAAGADKTVDGSGLDADDRHSIAAADMWLADPPADGDLYIEYAFDRVYKLHEMVVWNYNVQFELVLGFGLKDVTIEYSADGAEWMVLGDAQFTRGTARADYAANTVVDLQGVAAQFVRLTVNSGWGPMGQFGLSEVRFLYIPAHARQPQPADGATDVDPELVLNWRAGRDATAHEVYLGADPDALELVATTEQAGYVPDDVRFGGTYYWRVDAVSDDVWAGELWSFTTLDYAVVEDFESYTDDIESGKAIFDTWLDGWVNNTGSTVGYLETPFAERTIVHGGRQSMPLFYDNAGMAIAEAEYEFEAQDWTARGIKSLSLYFYGSPDNSGQLYVKINNTKVPYDGDPADIKKAVWQVWNIDLSTVGGNLSRVTKLTIGVEGAGVSGVLYIDDIRLYPQTPERIAPVDPGMAGLLAEYTFENGAFDSSGNGYNGTLLGNAHAAGGVLVLDGTDDAMAVPRLGGATATFNQCTYSMWLYSTVDPASRDFAGGINSDGWAAGGIHCKFRNGMANAGINGLAGGDLQGTTVAAANVWVHLALTVSDREAVIYLNGHREDSRTFASPLTMILGNGSVGAWNNNGDIVRELTGQMDDVRVYDRALSEEEILWLAGQRAPIHKPF